MRIMRPLFLILFSLILFCCSDNKSTNNLSANKDIDSLNQINNKIRKLKELWSQIKFKEHKSEGYILPSKEMRIYNGVDTIDIINVIEVYSIQPINIIEVSKDKIPEVFDDNYCNWANLVKGQFKDQVESVFYKQAILSGRWVYEIVKKHTIIRVDTLELLEVSNFDMESADHDGITGCDNFRILLVRKLNELKVDFIEMDEKKDYSYQFALLNNSDGAYDEITEIETKSDTIILNINSIYQEGQGTSKLKIALAENDFKGQLTQTSRTY